MSLEDEYLGRINPDEAREAHSRAESDCEHMPSAAWRALHAVGQMRYEYAVQRWTDGVGWETVCVRDTYEQVESLTYLWRDDMYRVARRPVGEWEHAPEVAE